LFLKDALEGVQADAGDEEDHDEYDELEEIRECVGGGRKRKGNAAVASAKKKAALMPQRLRPRTLASILVEESSRNDSVAKGYLDAEAEPPSRGRYPQRKFCPVTGLLGIYTDPKSGLPYANLRALEQIQERVPPWINLGGIASYMEAVKSLRNED